MATVKKVTRSGLHPSCRIKCPHAKQKEDEGSLIKSDVFWCSSDCHTELRCKCPSACKKPLCEYHYESRNTVDFVHSRELGLDRIERRHWDEEYPTRYLLVHELLREKKIAVGNLDKIFSCAWLDHHKIAFGTKCSKLMVYDTRQNDLTSIPLLASMQQHQARSVQRGLHSIRLNPCGDKLATTGYSSNDVAIYSLPDFEPLWLGEDTHAETIYDLAWLDDQFLVSGGRDGRLALWKVTEIDRSDDPDSVGAKCLKPITKVTCSGRDSLRALAYNPLMHDIVAVSVQYNLHLWDPVTLSQKYSFRLPRRLENVCLAVYPNNKLYAVGSKSHTSLIDARTGQCINSFPTRYCGCSVRSLSFRESLLVIGTGVGAVFVYDMRAGKYLQSLSTKAKAVILKASTSALVPEEPLWDAADNLNTTCAILTHAFDATGTRLFTAGGPLSVDLYGNYCSIWR